MLCIIYLCVCMRVQFTYTYHYSLVFHYVSIFFQCDMLISILLSAALLPLSFQNPNILLLFSGDEAPFEGLADIAVQLRLYR